MSARLEARGLAHGTRLERCDLDLAAGGLAMLVGPNGAGKTSLLQALAGIGGASGEVFVEGVELSKVPPARRVSLLSFLGASRDVAWPLTARDFVALGLAGAADSGRIDAALATLESTGFAGRRIDRLSTGERSRVMIARAIAPRAGVLLLDEPCANLDPLWQLAVIERLRAEAARGAAVLMSVHDLELARHHADRVLVVDRGAIVADAPPAEALSPEIVGKVFGVARSAGRWVRA